MQIILQLFINSLQNIAIYSMATIGIVLILRTSLTTNFAQGMMGTFAAFFSSNLVLFVNPNIPFWVAIAIGAAITFCIGFGVDAGIIRKGRYPNPISKQMITMGLMLIFYAALPEIFPSITIRTPVAPRFSFENINFIFLGHELFITKHALTCVIVAVIGLSVLFAMLKFTRWGIALRATASNETMAQMLGVNTRLVTGITWGIAGAFVAVAGSSTAMGLNAGMLAQVQIFSFLACVLGGITFFWSPIVGALLIPIFMNYATIFSTTWATLISFSLIMLIILVRPNGIFGKHFVKKV